MSCTEVNQSAIAEVRDQLSIDYSDGQYLNNATANLGLTRPVFGFSDDTWRAITKALALQFKQIRNKFHDVLSILLGPRITAVATQATAVAVGDKQVVVTDSSELPQVGILILDEGQESAETIEYCFIDRRTQTIYLETEATLIHSAYPVGDVESALLWPGVPGNTTLHIHVSDARKITVLPVTAVVGRGTASEEVVVITAVDGDNGTLTLSSALVNAHSSRTPSPIQNVLAQDYLANSEFLVLTSSRQFPDTGLVLLSASDNSFTATGGSTTSVTVAANAITADRHAGHIFVFDGNITAGLAGVQAQVIDNTNTAATFKVALPFAPVAGDTFSIRVVEKFTRNVFADNALQLSRDIADVTLIVGTEVELLKESATVVLAPVKVVGTGWDVIQTDPKNVEILIPEALSDINSVRSASYLHPAAVTPFATTLASPAAIGDAVLDLTSVTGLPEAGQLVIDAGGAAEEFLGYSRQRIVDTYTSGGSSVNVLSITTGGLTAAAYVGAKVYIGGPLFDVNTSRTIIANTASTITLYSAGAGEPLTNEQFAALLSGVTEIWIYHESLVNVENKTVAITHGAGQSVNYKQIIDAVTVQSGDIWSDANTFPGGYLYDLSQNAPAVKAAMTLLDQALAGPTTLSVDSFVGRTALEVADATLFPLGAVSPYTAILGEGSGNREVITISDVNLKQRTTTTVAGAGSAIGDTAIPVTALAGAGVADDFPNARGYRVLIDNGGGNEEVVFVTGTLTGPNRLVCEPTTVNHVATETVELMSDVLTVDPLDDNHIGSLKYAQRVDRWPGGPVATLAANAAVGDVVVTLSSTVGFSTTGNCLIEGKLYRYSVGAANTLNILSSGGIQLASSAGDAVVLVAAKPVAESVEVQYNSFEVVSTTGLPTTGGDLFLNFGKGILSVVGALDTAVIPPITTIDLVSTADFPVAYPYEIVINPGTGASEERALVTLNNTGLNRLTLDSATRIAHPIGTKVLFTSGDQELISYTGVSGATTLTASTPVVLQSNHSTSESIIQSPGRSTPGTDGYSFPFRMPTDLLFRIQFLFDLIRAAGVQVTVIETR